MTDIDKNNDRFKVPTKFYEIKIRALNLGAAKAAVGDFAWVDYARVKNLQRDFQDIYDAIPGTVPAGWQYI